MDMMDGKQIHPELHSKDRLACPGRQNRVWAGSLLLRWVRRVRIREERRPLGSPIAAGVGKIVSKGPCLEYDRMRLIGVVDCASSRFLPL